ncbi:hypothetical protein HK102_005830 [Quaeritorhiza haematococci]|nr:hypothetical protein HK102_005830 [Quaeritorhiza haematococci]
MSPDYFAALSDGAKLFDALPVDLQGDFLELLLRKAAVSSQNLPVHAPSTSSTFHNQADVGANKDIWARVMATVEHLKMGGLRQEVHEVNRGGSQLHLHPHGPSLAGEMLYFRAPAEMQHIVDALRALQRSPASYMFNETENGKVKDGKTAFLEIESLLISMLLAAPRILLDTTSLSPSTESKTSPRTGNRVLSQFTIAGSKLGTLSQTIMQSPSNRVLQKMKSVEILAEYQSLSEALFQTSSAILETVLEIRDWSAADAVMRHWDLAVRLCKDLHIRSNEFVASLVSYVNFCWHILRTDIQQEKRGKVTSLYVSNAIIQLTHNVFEKAEIHFDTTQTNGDVEQKHEIRDERLKKRKSIGARLKNQLRSLTGIHIDFHRNRRKSLTSLEHNPPPQSTSFKSSRSTSFEDALDHTSRATSEDRASHRSDLTVISRRSLNSSSSNKDEFKIWENKKHLRAREKNKGEHFGRVSVNPPTLPNLSFIRSVHVDTKKGKAGSQENGLNEAHNMSTDGSLLDERQGIAVASKPQCAQDTGTSGFSSRPRSNSRILQRPSSHNIRLRVVPASQRDEEDQFKTKNPMDEDIDVTGIGHSSHPASAAIGDRGSSESPAWDVGDKWSKMLKDVVVPMGPQRQHQSTNISQAQQQESRSELIIFPSTRSRHALPNSARPVRDKADGMHVEAVPTMISASFDPSDLEQRGKHSSRLQASTPTSESPQNCGLPPSSFNSAKMQKITATTPSQAALIARADAHEQEPTPPSTPPNEAVDIIISNAEYAVAVDSQEDQLLKCRNPSQAPAGHVFSNGMVVSHSDSDLTRLGRTVAYGKKSSADPRLRTHSDEVGVLASDEQGKTSLMEEYESDDALPQRRSSLGTSFERLRTMSRDGMEAVVRKGNLLHLSVDNQDVLVLEMIEGRLQVVAGCVENLIMRLADENVQDLAYVDCFIHCHKFFISSRDLLENLIARFEIEPPPNPTPEDIEYFAKWRKPIQIKVLTVIGRWVRLQIEDMADPLLRIKLESFLGQVWESGFKNEANRIKRIAGAQAKNMPFPGFSMPRDDDFNRKEVRQSGPLPPHPQSTSSLRRSRSAGVLASPFISKLASSRRNSSHGMVSSVTDHAIGYCLTESFALSTLPSPSSPELVDTSPLLDYDPRDLANYLTIADVNAFNSITMFVYIGKLLERKKYDASQTDSGQNVELRNWVALEICSLRRLRSRRKLLEKCIAAAKMCRQHNNFHSTLFIVSALLSPAVQRLKKTWKSVGFEYLTVLHELETLLDPSCNMKNYRNALASTNPPAVPFFPVVMKDATFVIDGNPAFFVGKEGKDESKPTKSEGFLVNFDKYRTLSKILSRYIEYGSSGNKGYEFAPQVTSAMKDVVRRIHQNEGRLEVAGGKEPSPPSSSTRRQSSLFGPGTEHDGLKKPSSVGDHHQSHGNMSQDGPVRMEHLAWIVETRLAFVNDEKREWADCGGVMNFAWRLAAQAERGSES